MADSEVTAAVLTAPGRIEVRCYPRPTVLEPDAVLPRMTATKVLVSDDLA